MSTVSAAFARARASLAGLGLADPASAPPLALDLLAGPASPLPWGTGSGSGPAAGGIGAAVSRARAGRPGCRDEVEAALVRIEATRSLGTVVALDEAAVRREADQLDAEAARGSLRGPLHGVCLTVKDVIDVAGLPTRAGSVALERPVAGDAPSVARLRAAGALILAKVATHEFALGVTTPQCRNPFDPDRISGGSSGGSAIAVATGVGSGSLGTDTRASLRVPASLCGVVGFKPTYGRVPTGGMVPLAWTVDHVGPIARSVADAALLLAVLAGDPGPPPAPPGTLDGLVVGVVGDALAAADPTVAAPVEQRLKALELLGCRLVDVAFPSAADLAAANDLGLLISRAEAAAFHRGAGTQVALCLPEVREQLELGLAVTAADYLDAQRQRAVLSERAVTAFRSCDLMASPTTPVTAPRRDGYEQALMRLSENTILWSLVGSPALSMPAGTDPGGLPVGLQLVAAAGNDHLLAGAAMVLEASS